MFNDVNGTNGDDFLVFQGQLGQISTTLTNPYSGYTIFIDDEFNINTGNYDGQDGTDFLFMSDFGDAFFVNDGAGNSLLVNVELIQAGLGGDLVILADDTVVVDDITIFGAQNDDVIWSNAGDDTIFGSTGDDIIDGGPGNDILNGQQDNDYVNGGAGTDTINGGTGDDTLYGGLDADVLSGDAGNDVIYGGDGDGTTFITVDKEFMDTVEFPDLTEGKNIKLLQPPGDPSLGVVDGNLDIGFQAQAEITFRQGFAGYNNSLGVYAIAADGTIQSAHLLWENVKDAGIDVTHIIDLPSTSEAVEIGFFIVANGDRKNHEYTNMSDTGTEGHIKFYYDYGGAGQRDATVYDDGDDITAVYDDGVTVRTLKGPIYHTTERDGSFDLNPDEEEHVVSGLTPGSNGQSDDVLRIGFEDLPNTGDADYEDVLFDLNIIETTVWNEGEVSDDILNGGDGNDTLYGEGGDDILIGGNGDDDLYGGFGSDIILYDLMVTGVDTIYGFETGVGGDAINITDILEGYDSGDDILDFVQLTDNGNGDTVLSVNADGDSGGEFAALAIIDGGVGNDTLSTLIDNGNLVVDQSVVI